MLNSIISALAVLLIQDAHAAPKMPELNKIKSVVLEGSYSCDDSKQYGLDVKNVGEVSYEYDLLVVNACKTPVQFMSGSGASLGLIADLGPRELEVLSWSEALRFSNVALKSGFQEITTAKEGHAYAVMINNSAAAGLMVVKVDRIQGEHVAIRYAVLQYRIIKNTEEAPGFDYEAMNK